MRLVVFLAAVDLFSIFSLVEESPYFSEPIRNCKTLIFSSFHTGDSKTSCHVLPKILDLAEIAKALSLISNVIYYSFKKQGDRRH